MKYKKSFTIVTLAILVLAGIFVYKQFFFTQKAGNFEIKEGDSGVIVAENLEARGFIRNSLAYRVFLKLCTPAPKLQAGIYKIEWGESFGELTLELSAIKSQEVTITIPEGWDLHDLAGFLEKNNLVSQRDFFRVTGVPAEDYRKKFGDSPNINWLSEFPVLADKTPYVSLEGYLFPDTYRMLKNFTAEDLVRKMLQNFVRKMGPLRAEIKNSGKSIFDIITMASIVENEVRTPKNRAMVADIFWRRLKLGIPLQSDATINYITRKGIASSSSNDLKINSPYNTYMYRGLPLGPIANPGMASINAALHPEPNQYLYFLTTNDGNIYYAKTYEDHLRNKAKYLK